MITADSKPAKKKTSSGTALKNPEKDKKNKKHKTPGAEPSGGTGSDSVH
jgi:hypothetical protein